MTHPGIMVLRTAKKYTCIYSVYGTILSQDDGSGAGYTHSVLSPLQWRYDFGV